MAVEAISKYSGVGEIATQRVFTQDSTDVYGRMVNTPQEHILAGFGQMEFISLLGTRCTGEARTVHSSFTKDWSATIPNNPNRDAAVDAERRRQLWRDWRRDNAAFRTQRVNSGFAAAPPQPEEPEPRDVQRFFDALEARFQSSSLDSLNLIQRFTPEANEAPEHMFSRFNQIAKAIKDE